MFEKTKSGAEASATQAKSGPQNLLVAGVSPRRIKDLAKRLKPFVEKARLEGLPSDQEGLDFVAGLFGFESYLAACALPAPFSMRVGETRKKTGPMFRKKKDPFEISSQEALGGVFALGTTGAGKTEALITLGVTALEQAPGMGLLMIDGKGEWAQYPHWLSHLSAMERERDFRVLNLLGVDRLNSLYHGHFKNWPTHRFDPIFGMDAPRLAKWLERSLGKKMLEAGPAANLPAPEDALELARALVMVWALDTIDLLCDPAQEPGVSAVVAAATLPERAPAGESHTAKAWRIRLSALLADPLWRMAANAMRTRALEPLKIMIEAYGDAFRCAKDDSGAWLEPQMRPDSPLCGQVCLVMLPALEKSTDELEDLGRLVTCSFQDAMESQEGVAGMRAMAILDEFGYYAPDASELIIAARGAGVGLVLAAQDLWACQKGSWRGNGLDPRLLSALGGLRVKLFMKTEDPSKESMRFVTGCFPAGRAPEIMDLKDQREGEAWAAGVAQPRQIRIDYRGDVKRAEDLSLRPVKCPRRAYGG